MAKKKKKDAEQAVKDGNVILFTALSMILLAFFIELNSLAVVDTNRKLEALGSLLGSFGVMPGGVSPSEGESMLPNESPIVSEGEFFSDNLVQMERYVVAYQLIKDVGFTFEGENLVISISNDLLFEPGSDDLKLSNLSFLNLVTRLIGTVENKMWIEGHLDNKETQSIETNPWDPSLRRSVKVVEHMINKGLLPPERFSIGGYGNVKPIIRKKGKIAKKNGRIDISFVGNIRIGKEKDDSSIYRFKGFTFSFEEQE